MKIAFLTTEYPHPRIKAAAGIGTSIRNLAEALVMEGHEPIIVVANQESSEIFIENGITFHLVEKPRFTFFSFYKQRRFLQRYINKHAEIAGWDILEAPDWTGLTAFMKLNLPVVIRLHGTETYFAKLEQRPIRKKYFWLEKLALLAADGLVSPSQFTADLSARLFQIKHSKIEIIPHGLQLDNFQNPDPHGFERGLLLYAGTIIRKKGVLELPDIFKIVCRQFPDARLLLLGADAADICTGAPSTFSLLKNALEDELRDRVIYGGKVSYEHMQAALLKAHVCVFPTFAETFGMVTLEAMAMNKAIVNSNMGWATEMLEHQKNGLLSDPKNHELFAQNIVDLLTDDTKRSQLADAARIRVESQYNMRDLVHQNCVFYKKFLAS